MAATDLTTAPAQDFPRPVTRQHRAFCKAVATGMTQVAAYNRYISRPGSSQSTTYVHACRVAGRYRAYIAHLRNKLAERAEEAGIMSKLEVLQYLSRAIRTPISEIDADSDLAQEQSITSTESGSISRIKSVNKLDAVSQLSKIAGFDAPTQHQHLHAIIDSPALAMLDDRHNTRLVSKTNLDKAGVVEVCGVESIQSTEESAPSTAWSAPSQLESSAGQEQ